MLNRVNNGMNRWFALMGLMVMAALGFSQTAPTEPDYNAVVTAASNKLGGTLAGYLPAIGILFAICLAVTMLFRRVKQAAKA